MLFVLQVNDVLNVHVKLVLVNLCFLIPRGRLEEVGKLALDVTMEVVIKTYLTNLLKE